VVDLEWHRKSLAEKLDWLKEALDDLVSRANHNLSVQQEQLRAITARLSALEKPIRKPTPARTRATKKPRRAPPRRSTIGLKPFPPSKRRR
jgi:uncharacterized coiled-coil protein SlyX